MCQSTSKKNRQVSPPTCGPMDWFKGNFRGKLWKAPYFMGFYLWFPVRIFPNKPIHWKSLNHNFPMVFLWFLYGGWGSSGQLRQRSGPALFRCGLPDHSDLRLRDLRHATGGAGCAVRTLRCGQRGRWKSQRVATGGMETKKYQEVENRTASVCFSSILGMSCFVFVVGSLLGVAISCQQRINKPPSPPPHKVNKVNKVCGTLLRINIPEGCSLLSFSFHVPFIFLSFSLSFSFHFPFIFLSFSFHEQKNPWGTQVYLYEGTRVPQLKRDTLSELLKMHFWIRVLI